MSNNRLSEADTLQRLKSSALNAGVELTYTHKLFFLRLTNIITPDNEGEYTVSMSVSELSEAFNMPTRTISECLKRLTAFDAIIQRERTRPQTRRLNKYYFIQEG